MSVLIFILLSGLIPSNHAFKAELCLPNKSNVLIASMETGMIRLIEQDLNNKKSTKIFYASFGQKRGRKKKEGDHKTPIGVYFATSIATRAELPDESYGAVAIPLNYPNPVDQRLKKTGHGIWIHGTDDIERLADKSVSGGCIVLDNKEILKLHKMIRVNKTPIIITNNFDDVKILSSNCKTPEITVNDNELRYKVTSSGLPASNVLYQVID